MSETGQTLHILHRGGRCMEPLTLGEMSEPGMANIGISEGGSSVNQYGDGRYRGLRNTEQSPED